MPERDALSAYLTWFLHQRGAFWFDAMEEPSQFLSKPSAVVVPFRRRAASRGTH